MKTILLVLTLNEINGMKAIMPKIKKGWVDQIIISDGGSTDSTKEWAEENGYGGEDWQSTGTYIPHSNYGSGMVYMFRATDVEEIQTPNYGDLEEVEIHLMNHSSITKVLTENRIVSLSIISALLISNDQNIFK